MEVTRYRTAVFNPRSYGESYQVFEARTDIRMTPDKCDGVYTGIVENIADPIVSGRVQVRVPRIHGVHMSGNPSGDVQFVPSHALPWARVVHMGGSEYDTGAFLPLSCGCPVIVIFEGGNPRLPVVIGTYHYHPTVANRTQTMPDGEWPKHKIPTGGKSAKNKPAPSVPTEVALTYVHSPTRGALLKTRKGHTIWYDDRDDAECFEIMDRCGQGLRLEGYVSGSCGGAPRRGIASVFSHSGVSEGKSRRVLLWSTDSGVTCESVAGSTRAQIFSYPLKVEANNTRQFILMGDVSKQIYVEVDTRMGIIRISGGRIDLHGTVRVFGDLIVYNSSEFMGEIISYSSALFNETNIHIPRVSVES